MCFLLFLAYVRARRDSRKPSFRCEWYTVLVQVHLVLKKGLPKNTVQYIILFLTWWFFSFIFFKTIRRISGKRLIKIRRIIASHVETEVSMWANTKYILCCFKKGLKTKQRGTNKFWLTCISQRQIQTKLLAVAPHSQMGMDTAHTETHCPPFSQHISCLQLC